MKYFAIGCFHFSIKKDIKCSISQYIQEIEIALNLLPSISELVISYNEDEDDSIIDCSYTGDSPLNNCGIFCPRIEDLNIDFNIYIPYRIQKTLLGYTMDTENFIVRMRDAYFAPFTIVECVNGSTNDASSAVVLIREFIVNEFSKLQLKINFEILGPSPFHADCTLSLASGIPIENKDCSTEELLFDVSIKTKRGYDEISFLYRIGDTDEDNIMDTIAQEISNEIGFFYYVIAEERQRSLRWEILMGDIMHLLEVDNIPRYKKILKKYKNIKNIIQDIVFFKAFYLASVNSISSHYRAIYKDGLQTNYFKDYIDNEIKDMSVYPVDDIYQLANFTFNKESKVFELFVVFLAAVSGGLIGAIITVIFSK